MVLDTQDDIYTLLTNTSSTFPDLKSGIWNLIGADIRGNQLRGELVFETQVLTASNADLEGYFGWVWNGTKPFQVDFDAELQPDGTLNFTSTALAAPVAGIIAAQYEGKFSLDYQSLTGTWFGNGTIPGTWSATFIEEPDPGLETTSDNIVVAALNLSARAYSDTHHSDQQIINEINGQIKNWSPLEATDLGFSATDTSFSKVGGAVDGDLLRYDFRNASATVGLTMLDGKRTLGISFEGTNDESTENGKQDWKQNIGNIREYYDSLTDFTQAVFEYSMKSANSIEQVLVTGHSLGGATAQNFLQDYGHLSSKFIGVTFGSPGTNFSQPIPEERFINIRHTSDPVPLLGEPRGYEVSGSIINVVAKDAGHTLFELLGDPVISYRETVEFITSQLDAKTLFRDMGIVSGTNGDDNLDATTGFNGEILLGGRGVDTMKGSLGSYTQIFNGGLGNDTIDGNGGVDYAIYSGARSSFTLQLDKNSLLPDQIIVTDQRAGPGSNGTDSLKSIERIIFTDFALALDLNGSAGIVAKLIGAVFGAGSISNAQYVAIGLSELDKGTSYEDLAALAIDAAGAKSPEQVTTLLWSNVVGSPPTTDQILPYIDMLHKETTVGTLGMFAAEHEINQANINLTGLVANGITFDPSYYQPIG